MEKNLHLLLQAMRELQVAGHHAHLIVVGDGQHLAEMQQETRDLSPAISQAISMPVASPEAGWRRRATVQPLRSFLSARRFRTDGGGRFDPPG